MGWLWGNSSPGKEADGLDAQTRELLEREAPARRTTPPDSDSSPRPAQTYRDRAGLTSPSSPPSKASQTTTSQTSASTAEPSPSPPTSKTLYPDGRYAHLWATYTPDAEAPSSNASQDQLVDLLTSYQTRRQLVSMAALENCVLEHIEENECFASGGFAKKMKGCLAESKRFNRCYTLQARLLKALGYMQALDDGVGEEVRDRMKMRADEIWAMVRAREEGGEVDVPVEISAMGENTVEGGTREERERRLLGFFSEEKRKAIEEGLQNVRPGERELEIRLKIAEAKVDAGYGDKIGEYYHQEREDRRRRREQGQSTFGDWLKRIGGWSQ